MSKIQVCFAAMIVVNVTRRGRYARSPSGADCFPHYERDVRNGNAEAAPPEGMPSPDDTWKLPNRDAMNANTVTVITAPAGGATSVFGSDMARVLDDGNIRVLPVLGKGPVHNVVDILNLKAIDMGMVVSDVPEFYRLQYKIPDITSQTALHREALQQRNPRRCADLCQIDL